MPTPTGSGNRVPDYRREINELKAEIRKLWQALGRANAGPPVQKEIVFSWAGSVTGSKLSGPWLAPSNLFITGCTMSQATAPSGTTSAALLINGSTVFTFTLFAGQPRGGTQSRHAVNVGDKVQLSVSGGGGSDLVANLSYVTNTGL